MSRAVPTGGSSNSRFRGLSTGSSKGREVQIVGTTNGFHSHLKQVLEGSASSQHRRSIDVMNENLDQAYSYTKYES